jgi:acetyltransferase
LLASWLGGATARPASDLLEKASIPPYTTPCHAVRGFSYLARHGAAQRQLMRTPPSLSDNDSPDRDEVRAILSEVLAQRRNILTEPEAKAILTAYRIPTVPTFSVVDAADAERAAETLREKGADAFVVKILSPDITHKSDVGGVRLGLADPSAVGEAARTMLADVARKCPDARLDGVVVQPMLDRHDATELIVGLGEDRVFGPVMLFGAGGTSVEVVNDKALALPPLDPLLARDMIDATRIGRLLEGYRDVAAADREAIVGVLVALSTLAADFPEIREIDINPLLASERGVIALDARIVIGEADAVAPGGNPRFAIRPWPSAWKRTVPIKDRTVTIRPIRPSDETFYPAMLAHLTPQDIHFRFFGAIGEADHRQIARLTQIDYAREIAFVAMDTEETEIFGVSRFAADPQHERAEFAVIVRSDKQGLGIGRALMRQLIEYAHADGINELYGLVMDQNAAMRRLAIDLGFTEADDPLDRTLQRFTMTFR